MRAGALAAAALALGVAAGSPAQGQALDLGTIAPLAEIVSPGRIASPHEVVSPRKAVPLAKAAPGLEPCPGKAGFVRLPGTRACTRLTGRVSGGADLRAGATGAAAVPTIAGRIAIDNRVDTEFGEVRTYVRAGNGRR